jgi:hypothetical protein
MKKIATVFTLTALLGLAGCGIDGHNQAELRPVNATDDRIYGDVGGPARQTLNQYKDASPDSLAAAQAKIAKIRAKLFPQ